jgi:hypothetical protein
MFKIGQRVAFSESFRQIDLYKGDRGTVIKLEGSQNVIVLLDKNNKEQGTNICYISVIQDDPCGDCVNDCRSEESRCPFYQE